MAGANQGSNTQAYLEAYSGYQLLAASITISIFTTTFLALRFYARTLTTASRSWDDFLLIPAWLFFVALATICYREANPGAKSWESTHVLQLVILLLMLVGMFKS